MEVNSFRETYSKTYDMLYQNKDYLSECDVLEQIFQRHGVYKIEAILDLGCGTGNHSIPLAERGYKMTGVDLSESMLAAAREKAKQVDLPVNFHKGDIRSIDLDLRYDAVLMMFAVLGYQISNADVVTTLTTARQHIRKDGLLIFDVWYGPGVLAIRPTDRIKIISTDGGSILRAASGELDVFHHTCTVNYNLWFLENENIVAETTEAHKMRYFFPMELEYFLTQTGFTLVSLKTFPEFKQNVDESTWNILVVAKAS